MSRNLEIEVKGLLSKDEYDKLLGFFPNQKPYVQTNFYIDTKGFAIKEKNCGLRIRQKGNKFELTLKIRQGDGKLEINQNITENDFKMMANCGVFPVGEVKEYIVNNLQIKEDEMFIFATMRTTRLDINYGESLISLDMSECFGEIDYEIECESSSLLNAKHDIKEFLEKYALKYKKFSASKLRRAIERYKKQ